MNNKLQRKALARTCALLISCQLTAAVFAAEPTIVEIKPNDTLSGIVVQAYPGYGNRRAVMQFLLDKNPQAFVNNNINRLIVGRKLQLPDVAELPGTATRLAVEAEPAASAQTQNNQVVSADAETLAKLNALTAERDKLSAALKALEAENLSLQSRITELEQLKAQQDAELQQLEEKIKALEVALAESQTAGNSNADKQVDQEELQQLRSINEASQSELKQLQGTHEAAQAELKQLRSANESAQAELEQSRAVNADLETQNQQLTQQLDEAKKSKTAAEAKNVALQEQATTLKADAPEVQQQLEQLKKSSEELKAENAELNSQLATAREQLTESQKDAEVLRAELADLDSRNATLSKDLEEMNLRNSDLQSALDVANEQNATLQTEMAQINAAAANDVNIVKEAQPAFDWTSLWPWLLALLLLPVAWLLGRRSHPVTEDKPPVVDVVNVSEPEVVDAQAEVVNAAIDPVVPTAEPGELDNISSPHIPVIPDNPDTALKLDMARAYLDLRDSEAANDMLQEVMREGGTQQQQEAREILSFIS
ncbi:MAG: FimV/HubP family polar landmark protein [Thiolinea sp.]